MKYKVYLVKDNGDVVDESAELLSAENAIGLIRAWESIISRPTTLAVDERNVSENVDISVAFGG